ncbi:A disintegrin and metalloproteinase with thrombospondin motifs 6-like [Branchiostoma floridae]|uniref:A disintegrin and metalloproteinase with thrombospondin motifs 6-like n=1 Tax=Branchiostoma floridae TaxID=7739 RepID=A0A9J7KGE4_BRAFL|nr:A disintegrin and metalloproteinase with thrombospondin motifs 6-like [Branchiostoma floridae]
MWRMIKLMHTENYYSVKLNGEKSKEFVTTRGVNQGGVLSLTCYLLSTNDVHELLQAQGGGASEHGLSEYLEQFGVTLEFPANRWKHIVKAAVGEKEEEKWDDKISGNDLVKHMLTECRTFQTVREEVTDHLTDFLGIRVAVEVHQQGDERLTGVLLGAHIGEENIETEHWEEFILLVSFPQQGVFSTGREEFVVEPVRNGTDRPPPAGHPHLVYRRSALRHRGDDPPCGVQDHHQHAFGSPTGDAHQWHAHPVSPTEVPHQESHREVPDPGSHTSNHSRRHRRSISRDHTVEVLVVADKMMVGYHKAKNMESYLLTIMNIVAKLYRDASIGNLINIVVTRLILITGNQPELEITNHADKSLDSFCKWQETIRPRHGTEDYGIADHDNAVLMTRLDICTNKNEPCGTLGLAPVNGMCKEARSCNINEDIGLASAFTIAHEMGHNFGMQHDGMGNECGLNGEPARIMAAQLTRDAQPFSWSRCSREYITNFLDKGQGQCLFNAPPRLDFIFEEEMAGQKYSADKQCELQYGSESRHCNLEDTCRELWCISKQGQCATNSIPAAEGTNCVIAGEPQETNRGWCYQGDCVPFGHRPEAVDGGWGPWSDWSACTRTCGIGVSFSERHCNETA